MALMGDEREERGQSIRRRREDLGVTSIHAFARATGLSREAITAAEQGRASLRTYVALEKWLDDCADPGPITESPLGTEAITVEVTGPSTKWHVKFSGPAALADELRRQARELLKEIALDDTPDT